MPLQALFVHGMGRSPLSGYLLLRKLRRAGLHTHTFAYSTALQDFDAIVRRLVRRIERVATAGEYILVGHSLGGVMIRAALARHPARLPAHVFLLGSPVKPARLARMLGKRGTYRLLTGDCGQLLGSVERMAEIGAVSVPTTAIVGTRGWPLRSRAFGSDVNDGVVGLDEVTADWITDAVPLPVVHTLLPASGQVAQVILERLRHEDRS